MPPKKKPPSQAGKFKPLKRPSRRSDASASASAAASRPASSAAAGVLPDSRGRPQDGGAGGSRSRGASPGRGGRGGRGDGERGRGEGGRGRGRGGRGGRDGRGRGGRGQGRGRFIVPTGQAFFTGQSVRPGESPGAGGGGPGAPNPETFVAKVSAGTDGAVFMPGSKGARASVGSSNNRRVAMSAAESMAAAARAKAGEGEEIIVAEMLDLDDADEDAGKKRSVLDGPSGSRFDGMPSLFDDENNEVKGEIMPPEHHGISDAFLYDSDSSAEERRATRRREHGDRSGGFRLPPMQLPFPVAAGYQQTMYDCQDAAVKGEEKKDDADNNRGAAMSSSKLSDPPLQSPFLDLDSVSQEMKRMESDSWFVMKFPTRLPHLETQSASDKKVAFDEGVIGSADGPAVGSLTKADISTMQGTATPSAGASSSGVLGYDDTLKDAAAGRYGRIVVRKSGKTELVIGGGEGQGPEIRMLVHEGLQCGFRQEAVCINPEEATFVSMGDVDKSLIVTPDIERAFEFS